MTRNLKVLGLAAVAALAMSAMVASAASAAEFHTTTKSTTHIKGEQTTQNVFTVNNRTVKCNTATFTAHQEEVETVNRLEAVHPTYSNCEAFGLEATVTTTGCDYDFNEPNASLVGSVDVVCAEGPIVINAGGGTCTVTVGSQTGLNSVSYTNNTEGGNKSVTVTANVSGIKAHVTGPLLTCGTNGEREATYTGSVLTKGFDSGGAQGSIFVE